MACPPNVAPAYPDARAAQGTFSLPHNLTLRNRPLRAALMQHDQPDQKAFPMRWRSLLMASAAAAAIAAPAFATPSLMPVLRDTELRESMLKLVAYSPVVYEIQAGLSSRGYNPGPADGAFGSRTRTAIEAYQRDNGLAVTGQPSQSLADHLRQASRPPTVDPGMSLDRVERLQRDLDRLGYSVSVNGLADQRTRDAIRQYERDRNLPVTGEPTDALVDHVRQTAMAAPPPAPAIDTATLGRIQTGLRARGYSVATTSGDWDASTEAAIRAYQRDRGLTVNGQASAELASLLGEGLPAPVATRDNIRAVQTALNQRGYSAGVPDGYMSPATRAAIQSYTQRTGLPASANVTQGLLASLGIGGPVASQPVEPGVTRGRVVLRDTFDDNNFDTNPVWKVLGQAFKVESGWLKSSVTLSPQTQEDRQRALVSGLLQQVFGVQLAQEPNTAGIATGVSFPNDYVLNLTVRETSNRPGRMNLGAYTGNNATHGYRLLYDGQAAQPLSIIAGSPSGFTQVASTSQGPKLDDGNTHRITINRATSGRLSVVVDDVPVLSVTDQSITATHEGVSFVNASGDWEIDEVEVVDQDPRQPGQRFPRAASRN